MSALAFLITFAVCAWLLELPAAHHRLVAGIKADQRKRLQSTGSVTPRG